MKNISKNIVAVLLLAALAFTSCEKIAMDANPSTDNKSIFEEYVTLVTEKYAMLEFKNVDITAMADSIRPTITDNMSEKELFDKMGLIAYALKDGHSVLDAPSDTSLFASFDFIEGWDSGLDYDILLNNYLPKTQATEQTWLISSDSTSLDVVYTRLSNNKDIGYFWIPSWNNNGLTGEQIDAMFASFSDTKGLIIDMRGNTGGDPSLATKVASYLTDKSVYTGFERFKTGPGVNDFSDSQVDLRPASSDNLYLKPVVVLTDRFCYSATTTFLYSTNPLDHVTTMGQRSGGGSGSVADGYLANGWHWGLSTSEFIDHLGNHLDDGIDPDIKVALDLNDTSKDEVIEAAIQFLH